MNLDWDAPIDPVMVGSDDNLWSRYADHLFRNGGVFIDREQAEQAARTALVRYQDHRAYDPGVDPMVTDAVPGVGSDFSTRWDKLDRSERVLVAAWTWPGAPAPSPTPSGIVFGDMPVEFRHLETKLIGQRLTPSEGRRRVGVTLGRHIDQLRRSGLLPSDDDLDTLIPGLSRWARSAQHSPLVPSEEVVIVETLLEFSRTVGLSFGPHPDASDPAGVWQVTKSRKSEVEELARRVGAVMDRTAELIKRAMGDVEISHKVERFHRRLVAPPAKGTKYYPLFEHLDAVSIARGETYVMTIDQVKDLLDEAQRGPLASAKEDPLDEAERRRRAKELPANAQALKGSFWTNLRPERRPTTKGEERDPRLPATMKSKGSHMSQQRAWLATGLEVRPDPSRGTVTFKAKPGRAGWHDVRHQLRDGKYRKTQVLGPGESA